MTIEISWETVGLRGGGSPPSARLPIRLRGLNHNDMFKMSPYLPPKTSIFQERGGGGSEWEINGLGGNFLQVGTNFLQLS